jgi:hypothetical protein
VITWLRRRSPDDHHMPAERRGLRADWHRAYLRAYGATLAARIRGYALPEVPADDLDQLYRFHWPEPVAQQAAARASLTPCTPPPAISAADTAPRAAARPDTARPGLSARAAPPPRAAIPAHPPKPKETS